LDKTASTIGHNGGADILVRLAQGSSPAAAVDQVRLELLQQRLQTALEAR
jgi:hypothetical protein